MIVISKHYWQTIFVLTLVSFPEKLQLAMKQKNRSVKHENSKEEKVILGHRIHKVRGNRLREEKGLLKHEAWDYIGHEAHKTQSM